MKCDKCIYLKMCKILAKYMDIGIIISELTECKEPNYIHACQHLKQIYNFCVHYKEKKEAGL